MSEDHIHGCCKWHLNIPLKRLHHQIRLKIFSEQSKVGDILTIQSYTTNLAVVNYLGFQDSQRFFLDFIMNVSDASLKYGHRLVVLFYHCWTFRSLMTRIEHPIIVPIFAQVLVFVVIIPRGYGLP